MLSKIGMIWTYRSWRRLRCHSASCARGRRFLAGGYDPAKRYTGEGQQRRSE